MQNYGYTPYSYANPYSASPYSPRFSPQMPQMAQPQPQPQPQPQMQNIPSSPQINQPQIQGIMYATEEEAKPFIIFPNSSAYFIDSPKKRLYVKSADSSGISTFEYFSLVPINADGTPIAPQEPMPQFKPEDFANKFVPIEKFDELVSRFEELKKFVGERQRVVKNEQ